MPVPKQAPSYARLTFLLRRGYRLTKYDAADWVHVHQRTAQRRLDQIYTEGLVYISAWKRAEPNQWIPQYAWGKGQDAVKPAPIPVAERRKKYANDPDNREIIKAKKRISRVIKKADKIAGNEIFNLIARRA
jgi:hypothetical protein